MTELGMLGDGRRKSKFDPDLARRVNEESEIEARQKKIDELKRKNGLVKEELKEEPTPEPATASPIIVSVDYDNLQIEQLSPREGVEKKLFYYDKSLADLRTRLKNPNARHLGHREVFGIIMDGLEGRLDDPKLVSLKQIYSDMISSYGEWLSLAMQRKGDTLYCYEKPEGLVGNGSNYVQKNFTYSGQPKTFDIAGIASGTYVDLEKFKSNLVEYLYGRTFAKLPDVMKEGGKRAQLLLPLENMGVRPVGRGGIGNRYEVDAYYDRRASRGVVPVAPEKSEVNK